MSREPEDHDHPHVHFQEASDGVKSNEIVIKRKSENKLEIQLGNFCFFNETLCFKIKLKASFFPGFLQINHVYDVCIMLKRNMLPTDCEIK